MKRNLLAALIGISCLAATTTATYALGAQDKPNIVYIIVDDQRYDAMGFINSDAVTPNMDAMAPADIIFAGQYSDIKAFLKLKGRVMPAVVPTKNGPANVPHCRVKDCFQS